MPWITAYLALGLLQGFYAINHRVYKTRLLQTTMVMAYTVLWIPIVLLAVLSIFVGPIPIKFGRLGGVVIHVDLTPKTVVKPKLKKN